MKVVGIIVEYNPLHNGHRYHIKKVREESNADIVIAVMSSSITMRGDLSIFDKFTKTRQAMENDVDLVIELPLVYAMHRSDIFAKNAVDILNSLMVDEIWIGSEENNIKLYEEYYNTFNINPNQDKSISYKTLTTKEIPFDSNDILGFGYYKAIKDNNYNINLYTIKRKSSNYLDTIPTDSNITSALSIRHDLSLINNYCPSFVSKETNKILNEELLFSQLKYKILSTSTSDLKDIFFVDEGLENRLHSIVNYNSLNEFINSLSTKKYTKTRIKRMLMYILFNINKDEINEIQKENIPYVRILGYNNIGQEYINKIKKNVLIYSNIKNGLHKSLDIELKVSKILDSIYNLNLLKLEQSKPYKKED